MFKAVFINAKCLKQKKINGINIKLDQMQFWRRNDHHFIWAFAKPYVGRQYEKEKHC